MNHAARMNALRITANELDAYGFRTMAARLAQHQMDADRMAVRTAKGRDLPRGDRLRNLRDARLCAWRYPSPNATARYFSIRNAAVSPLSVRLP